jgi:hypothetical protein
MMSGQPQKKPKRRKANDPTLIEDKRLEAAKYAFFMLDGPSPCDSCTTVPVCRTGKACRDFVDYALKGKVLNADRTPSTKIYQKLFKHHD